MTDLVLGPSESTPAVLRAGLVLDPAEVATSERVELVLEPDDGIGPIFLRPEGPNWGTADVEAYMAAAALGQLPAGHRVPNRLPSFPLTLQSYGDTTFEEAKAALQSKVSLFNEEGGWLKYTGRSGTAYYLDIVGATLDPGEGRLPILSKIDPNVDLVLEAIPDFYEDEDEIGAESSANGRLSVLLSGLRGNFPGRVRHVLTNTSEADQLGLFGCVRSRHYSPDPTAQPYYPAVNLTPLGSAAVATRDGHDVVRQGALSNLWTPVLGTNLVAEGDYLTHTGTNRIRALVYSEAGLDVVLRLVWDVGDMTLPRENPLYQVPGVDNFYIADLGEVRLDANPVGTHRWQGQIQGMGASGGEDIDILDVFITNADESTMALSTPSVASPIAEERVAWDAFNLLSSGALAGQSAPAGGAWEIFGDPVGPGVDDSTHLVERDETGDASGFDGMSLFVLDGATYGEVTIDFDVNKQHSDGVVVQGIAARLIDEDNFFFAGYQSISAAGPSFATNILLVKVVSGTPTITVLWSGGFDIGWKSLRVALDELGNVQLYVANQGGALSYFGGLVEDADLAAGGALDVGEIGGADQNTGGAVTRQYDNFYASRRTEFQVPNDAVMYAGRSVELRTDGVYRESLDGEASGPLVALNDLPRMPPAGLEGRVAEVFFKQSRGDLAQLPDGANADPFEWQGFYRPSWIFPPE